MTIKDRPLSWYGRVLAPSVRRNIHATDGRPISITAYPKGMPRPGPQLVDFTPAIIDVIHDAYAYLRYRLIHRGAWVLEIRDRSIGRIVSEKELPNRRTAMAQFEEARLSGRS